MHVRFSLSVSLLLLLGCGDPVSSMMSADLGPDGRVAGDLQGDLPGVPKVDSRGGAQGDPQLPPVTGGKDLTDWLQAGFYKTWHCEAMPHPAGKHGAHGTNRICSNDVLAAASDRAEYPVGSASVKELYSGASISGYAVSERIKAGAGGDSWYWNEYGFGSVGNPSCTGCHSLAGSGGDYIGHDFVFVKVK